MNAQCNEVSIHSMHLSMHKSVNVKATTKSDDPASQRRQRSAQHTMRATGKTYRHTNRTRIRLHIAWWWQRQQHYNYSRKIKTLSIYDHNNRLESGSYSLVPVDKLSSFTRFAHFRDASRNRDTLVCAHARARTRVSNVVLCVVHTAQLGRQNGPGRAVQLNSKRRIEKKWIITSDIMSYTRIIYILRGPINEWINH